MSKLKKITRNMNLIFFSFKSCFCRLKFIGVVKISYIIRAGLCPEKRSCLGRGDCWINKKNMFLEKNEIKKLKKGKK